MPVPAFGFSVGDFINAIGTLLGMFILSDAASVVKSLRLVLPQAAPTPATQTSQELFVWSEKG